MKIEWPKGEPTPKSLEEARALGWKPCEAWIGVSHPWFSAEHGSELPVCEVRLRKIVEGFDLSLTIKATVQFSEQTVCEARAYEEKPEKPMRKRLFDVTYYLPNRSIQVLAVDKDDASSTAAAYADLELIVKPAKSARKRVPLFK